MDFANEYKLEIIPVVKPIGGNDNIEVKNIAFTDEGEVVNSSVLNGLTTQEAKKEIIKILEKII